MGRLLNKKCLVTGGAQGLGLATATAFVREGGKVFITDINEDQGQKSAKEIGARFIHQDVCDEGRWHEIESLIKDECGGLDVLVNNAGIANLSMNTSPENTPLDEWRLTFKVNMEGVFLGCKTCMPLMRESGGGSIINLSSLAGIVPTPFVTAYGASKAAVMQFSTSVALHGAPDKIRCNSVHPGQIQTEMHNILLKEVSKTAGAPLEAIETEFESRIPLGSFSLPEDIANSILFLASDESRHITGTQVVVDGGMTLTN